MAGTYNGREVEPLDIYRVTRMGKPGIAVFLSRDPYRRRVPPDEYGVQDENYAPCRGIDWGAEPRWVVAFSRSADIPQGAFICYWNDGQLADYLRDENFLGNALSPRDWRMLTEFLLKEYWRPDEFEPTEEELRTEIERALNNFNRGGR